MINDLQTASFWKRIAAWLFDAILLSVLAAGFAFVLSFLLGYDGHSQNLDRLYAEYETEYGVVFDITQEQYQAMDDARRENYDRAYRALSADEEVLYAYNMTLNLSLLITTGGILLAMVLWEYLIPLWFGNGQTLGKKIFGLCLVRNDGVKMNNMQLFTRTVLGKFTLETMIPVYTLMMLFWGTVGLWGTMLLLALVITQLVCMAVTRTNSAIHDLMAGTVVVDMASQTIFRTTEELIEYQKRIAAERAARQPY